MILTGDCREELCKLPDDSIDAVITDPPYGLKFMGKKWDYDVPSVEIWREVLRVLKPGGHLLSFGGTRTYHRMVTSIEDAGFEIRDQLQWIYGSGFPKSLDISKAIDKEAGVERTRVVGKTQRTFADNPSSGSPKGISKAGVSSFGIGVDNGRFSRDITAPATPAAKNWHGWGTALKPSNEPIVLARKPISEKTVAKNILRWGVGGLNIDASRIGSAAMGRFPANTLFDFAAAELLDEQSLAGGMHSAGKARSNQRDTSGAGKGMFPMHGAGGHRIGDSGGASRFFYVAKASKRERGEGNAHPTVKPVKLMEYLVKLITPPNGTVLDPFMGSGTTGVACKRLGFKFVGIELDAAYAEIAERRISL